LQQADCFPDLSAFGVLPSFDRSQALDELLVVADHLSHRIEHAKTIASESLPATSATASKRGSQRHRAPVSRRCGPGKLSAPVVVTGRVRLRTEAKTSRKGGLPATVAAAILARMKQRVYVETTIISYLTARPSRDVVVAAHQELTRQWWEARSVDFELVVSELVREEAVKGDEEASSKRIATIAGMAILRASNVAVSLAERLVSKGSIPRESAADALHVAIAAVNGIDYLLTWNCKHLANATLRGKIQDLVEQAGYACPVICTPEELMEDIRYG
jgi:predicted nucleic acid-binding protein